MAIISSNSTYAILPSVEQHYKELYTTGSLNLQDMEKLKKKSALKALELFAITNRGFELSVEARVREAVKILSKKLFLEGKNDLEIITLISNFVASSIKEAQIEITTDSEAKTLATTIEATKLKTALDTLIKVKEAKDKAEKSWDEEVFKNKYLSYFEAAKKKEST